MFTAKMVSNVDMLRTFGSGVGRSDSDGALVVRNKGEWRWKRNPTSDMKDCNYWKSYFDAELGSL